MSNLFRKLLVMLNLRVSALNLSIFIDLCQEFFFCSTYSSRAYPSFWCRNKQIIINEGISKNANDPHGTNLCNVLTIPKQKLDASPYAIFSESPYTLPIKHSLFNRLTKLQFNIYMYSYIYRVTFDAKNGWNWSIS